MNGNDYILATRKTAMYLDVAHKIAFELPADQIEHIVGLQYEAGELADEASEALGKVKKIVRDSYGVPTEEQLALLKKELGDVFYPMARLCDRFGWTFEEIMSENIAKLMSRLARGKVGGSGDLR